MCLGMANGGKTPEKEMTPQEAIEILNLSVVSSQAPQFKMAIEVAKEALEKQIPKKAKGLSVNTEGMRVGNCPACNRFVADKYDKTCLCGQRLNWEE